MRFTPRQAALSPSDFPASCKLVLETSEFVYHKMWPLTYMSIITIELLKNCHTAMFFMCFDLLYYFVKKASFCYWIVLLCYIDIIFLLPLKTDIKGPLLFYSTNISTRDNMWIIILDLLFYTWYLTLHVMWNRTVSCFLSHGTDISLNENYCF